MPTHRVDGVANADGSWTQFSVARDTVGPGVITFDPIEKAGVSFCIRLRRTRDGQVFTDEICWCEHEDGPKVLATNVIAGAQFTIDARGTNGRTNFSGDLTTA